MNHASTLFLKLVICLIVCAVLVLCLFVFPAGISTDVTGMYRPLLIGMYIPAIPFFIAAYQAFQLLNLIDHNKAFSPDALRALQIIQYCAFTITGLYGVGLPYIYSVADRDDAPGVMVIGLVFTFAPLVIGVAAAVLRNMFNNASKLKQENDLTV